MLLNVSKILSYGMSIIFWGIAMCVAFQGYGLLSFMFSTVSMGMYGAGLLMNRAIGQQNRRAEALNKDTTVVRLDVDNV